MAFTEQEKRAAWNKAREVDGYDKNMFRKDACGAWIAWSTATQWNVVETTIRKTYVPFTIETIRARPMIIHRIWQPYKQIAIETWFTSAR